MSNIPKLNFRAKPLLVPVIRRDVENQKPPPPKPPKPKPLRAPNIRLPAVPSLPSVPKLSEARWVAFPLAFGLLLCLRMWLHVSEVHTIHSLPCRQSNREVRCRGAPKGTFVVDVPPNCGSVYEIDGIPFSAAQSGNVFRVPALHLSVKDVFGDCAVQAYLDSVPSTISMPFTWVTTHQHKKFTIHVDDQVVVESAVASLFPSVSRGVWVAYSFDFPKSASTVRVTGDGTDIIHTYPAR